MSSQIFFNPVPDKFRRNFELMGKKVRYYAGWSVPQVFTSA
jgi:hypothetical protein